mgnify:CR=1 FL=1
MGNNVHFFRQSGGLSLVADYQFNNNLIDSVGGNVEAFNKAFPKYNNMGSDFFMGLGANILAAPGGQPILQTLGTAAKEPL